jgi:hypothetical protein
VLLRNLQDATYSNFKMTGKIKQVQKFFDKCVYKQKAKNDFRSHYDPLFHKMKMENEEEPL